MWSRMSATGMLPDTLCLYAKLYIVGLECALPWCSSAGENPPFFFPSALPKFFLHIIIFFTLEASLPFGLLANLCEEKYNKQQCFTNKFRTVILKISPLWRMWELVFFFQIVPFTIFKATKPPRRQLFSPLIPLLGCKWWVSLLRFSYWAKPLKTTGLWCGCNWTQQPVMLMRMMCSGFWTHSLSPLLCGMSLFFRSDLCVIHDDYSLKKSFFP